MTGILSNSQRAKALGNKEEQKGATASTPNYALTTGDVVIDGMTPSRVGTSKAVPALMCPDRPTLAAQKQRVEGGAPG
jgi:hypothetical protein